MVDKNCNITGFDGSNHRSDSGLLQVNWVNYDSKRLGRPAFLCREFAICSQEPLLDPFINLVAGKAMYDVMGGWAPWDPCQWGPKFKRQCRASEFASG